MIDIRNMIPNTTPWSTIITGSLGREHANLLTILGEEPTSRDTPDDDVTNQMVRSVDAIAKQLVYTATGTANNIELQRFGYPDHVETLIDGMTFFFKPKYNNTDSVNIKLNNLPVKALIDADGNTLEADDLRVGFTYICRYDGSSQHDVYKLEKFFAGSSGSNEEIEQIQRSLDQLTEQFENNQVSSLPDVEVGDDVVSVNEGQRIVIPITNYNSDYSYELVGKTWVDANVVDSNIIIDAKQVTGEETVVLLVRAYNASGNVSAYTDIHIVVRNLPKLDAVVLDNSTMSLNSDSNIVVTIANYDADATYIVTSSNGILTSSRVGDAITISVGEVVNNFSSVVSVVARKDNFIDSDPTLLEVNVLKPKLPLPTVLSSVVAIHEGTSVDFEITNFSDLYTYSVQSSNSGVQVSFSDGVVTMTATSTEVDYSTSILITSSNSDASSDTLAVVVNVLNVPLVSDDVLVIDQANMATAFNGYRDVVSYLYKFSYYEASISNPVLAVLSKDDDVNTTREYATIKFMQEEGEQPFKGVKDLAVTFAYNNLSYKSSLNTLRVSGDNLKVGDTVKVRNGGEWLEVVLTEDNLTTHVCDWLDVSSTSSTTLPDDNIRNVSFNSNGTRMYHSWYYSGDHIKEYVLSTPWDPSTRDGGGSTAFFFDTITFNEDGTKILYCESGTITSGVLTTPFDLTTFDDANKQELSTGLPELRVTVSEDGMSIYTLNQGTAATGIDEQQEYSLLSSWDVGGAIKAIGIPYNGYYAKLDNSIIELRDRYLYEYQFRTDKLINGMVPNVYVNSRKELVHNDSKYDAYNTTSKIVFSSDNRYLYILNQSKTVKGLYLNDGSAFFATHQTISLGDIGLTPTLAIKDTDRVYVELGDDGFNRLNEISETVNVVNGSVWITKTFEEFVAPTARDSIRFKIRLFEDWTRVTHLTATPLKEEA